ncbi:MAG TPA: hypothetical protein PLH83_06725 [Ruminococcus sp.]|nr:hypothetical protein [Ruminococcus sp.]
MNKDKKNDRIIKFALIVLLIIGIVGLGLHYGALLFGTHTEGTVTSRMRLRKSSKISAHIEYYVDNEKKEDRLIYSKRKAPQVGDKVEISYLPFMPGTIYGKGTSGAALAPILLIGSPAASLYLLFGKRKPSENEIDL